MAQIPLTAAEIEKLGRRLDELGELLTENERAVLLAVFGMAATSLQNAVASSERESGAAIEPHVAEARHLVIARPERLPALSEGFKDAFLPGAAGRFSVSGVGPVENSIDVSVGSICVSVGWSKDIAFLPTEGPRPMERVGQPPLGGLGRPGIVRPRGLESAEQPASSESGSGELIFGPRPKTTGDTESGGSAPKQY